MSKINQMSLAPVRLFFFACQVPPYIEQFVFTEIGSRLYVS